MELHQIRYFLALCEERNFTRAADRCAVAQSSLTRAIKTLERELGGALFHRDRAQTRLSRLGEKVKPLLEQAYRHVQRAQREAQDCIRERRTSLRLGLMRSIAPWRLIGLVTTIRARHPGVALQVYEASAPQLQQRLVAGDLDAAICALPAGVADERLTHLPLYREPIVAVMRATHRLAARELVRLEDLHGEPYLARTDQDGEVEALAHFGARGAVFQSEREDWILAMAAAGLGVGLIPAHSATYPGVSALRVEPEIAREISLVTLRVHDALALGALLREAMRNAGSAVAIESRTLAEVSARQ